MLPKSKDYQGHIDPAAKKALLDLGNDDFYLKVVGVFLDASEKFVHDLQSEEHKEDLKKLKMIAHTWKSSAQGIGANELSKLCKELEMLSDLGDDKKKLLISAILTEYSHVKAELLPVLKAS